MSAIFDDGEKHLSQVPAMHLLQVMKPSWTLLSNAHSGDDDHAVRCMATT